VFTLKLTDPAKLKAQKTYDLASDYFDDRPLGFWARYGRRTVERLALPLGARVLDVACGTGASAVPAAEAVGPTGRVTGVDLADRLLAQGREKAKQKGLTNLEFLQADMTELGYPAAHFDAVICVFGVFFVAKMESLVAELWRMVRPGGKLAVTTWGPRIFAPAYDVWNEAVRKVRPDLYAAYNPWDRITTPEAVRTLCRGAGVPSVDVEPEGGYQPLSTPEDFWTIALGSGLRWTIDQLGVQGAEQVKQIVLAWLAAHKVDRLETNVIYAVATRGPKG
jgi:ubiquinone/menaquinone biosynthesis C-methylase UbiE